MTTFYNLRVGDKVQIKDEVHTIIGKSLGRDWSALRTDAGLVKVTKKQNFEVMK
jgi:hypothetical protein